MKLSIKELSVSWPIMLFTFGDNWALNLLFEGHWCYFFDVDLYLPLLSLLPGNISLPGKCCIYCLEKWLYIGKRLTHVIKDSITCGTKCIMFSVDTMDIIFITNIFYLFFIKAFQQNSELCIVNQNAVTYILCQLTELS